jgi:predicted enzyme related to lactoylglutathione lyase
LGQPVVYFDIGCKEIEKTQGFYSKIFGWKPIDRSEHTVMLDPDPHGIPGAITSLGHEPHNYVMIYIEVDDIPAYLEKVEANGGEVLVPMTEIPDGGHFAWFGDPEGNMIGLLDPGSNDESE